jgi:hypothetical protein
MFLNITRERLAVLHAASTDETRFNINAVRFEADGTLVATDGHILAVSKLPAGERDLVAKLEPFQIGLEDARSASKLAGTGKNSSGLTLDIDATNESGRAGRVSVTGRRKSEWVPESYEKADTDYPNWEQVTAPKRKVDHKDVPGFHRVGLSLAVLESLVAIGRQATKTHKGETQTVEFSFPENPDAMVTATLPGEHAEGLEVHLMPMRLK